MKLYEVRFVYQRENKRIYDVLIVIIFYITFYSLPKIMFGYFSYK